MLMRRVQQSGNAAAQTVRVRCPGCRDQVTLDSANDNDRAFRSEDGGVLTAGQRQCPNPDCRTHVFVVYSGPDPHGNVEVAATYPAERVDFDADGLPTDVLAAIEEAITCHAQGCYVASAMMVRKTLEEVCRDRGAEGENLKQRIAALGGKVVLPQALLDGLDDLRLLGNDAAHVESRDYEQVGQQEVEIAIDVTKEILKATYQLDSIVNRLRSLRRS